MSIPCDLHFECPVNCPTRVAFRADVARRLQEWKDAKRVYQENLRIERGGNISLKVALLMAMK